jgi:hypothetical protein
MPDKTERLETIVESCAHEFEAMKRIAERAIAQLDDAQLRVRINPRQNSIALIIQHMAGNMRSRWTDWLTTDGEKPDRNRESEFVDRNLARAQLMAEWEQGWKILFTALSQITDADLGRIVVRIRNEPHTAFAAINRQTAHYALHVGHILLIAKHLLGEKWQYLTIPPGGSAAFNAGKGV